MYAALTTLWRLQWATLHNQKITNFPCTRQKDRCWEDSLYFGLEWDVKPQLNQKKPRRNASSAIRSTGQDCAAANFPLILYLYIAPGRH